ncbi:MAG TPA: hypothetical protein VGC56_01965 [Allosphingosinicella sp.]|jgi:hypothetical protein
MAGLDGSPLLRTDFSDEAAWKALIAAVSAPSPEGFRAEIYPVENRDFEGAEADRVAAADWNDAGILFIADRDAMQGDEQAVLCVDLVDGSSQPFRCIASELWGVENNLRLGNMDYSEFADLADVSRVFRGFP